MYRPSVQQFKKQAQQFQQVGGQQFGAYYSNMNQYQRVSCFLLLKKNICIKFIVQCFFLYHLYIHLTML